MILRFSAIAMTVALLSQAASAADVLVVHGQAPSFGHDTVYRQIGIKIGDVNAADPAGAATLLARIQQAADMVCTGAVRGHAQAYADRIAKCRTKTIAQAVKEVGTPALDVVAANAP